MLAVRYRGWAFAGALACVVAACVLPEATSTEGATSAASTTATTVGAGGSGGAGSSSMATATSTTTGSGGAGGATTTTGVGGAPNGEWLVVFGGFGNTTGNSVVSSTLRAVMAMDGAITDWDDLPIDMPVPAGMMGVATAGARAIAVGGWIGVSTDGRRETRILTRSQGSLAWSLSHPMDDGRWGVGAALLGDRMYIAGGRDAYQSPTALAEVWAADLFGAGIAPWELLDPLPEVVEGALMLGSGDRLFVFGGSADESLPSISGDVRTATVADGAPGVWADELALPYPQRLACGATLGGRGFLVGGQSTNAVLDTVTSVDLTVVGPISSWGSAGTLPTALFGAACAVLGARLYVIGGMPELVLDATTEVWSAPISGSLLGGWRAEAPLPEGRFLGSAVVLGP